MKVTETVPITLSISRSVINLYNKRMNLVTVHLNYIHPESGEHITNTSNIEVFLSSNSSHLDEPEADDQLWVIQQRGEVTRFTNGTNFKWWQLHNLISKQCKIKGSFLPTGWASFWVNLNCILGDLEFRMEIKYPYVTLYSEDLKNKTKLHIGDNLTTK